MTDTQLKKLPKSATNQAIEDRAIKKTMGVDMRYGYKEGEKAMRDILMPEIWERDKQIKSDQEEIKRLRSINEQLIRG